MPIDQLFARVSDPTSRAALLDGLLKSPSAKGALGGAASGALVALLMNKKARKAIGSTAVKAGGAAALAGLGYYAYRKWQENQARGVVPAPPPAPPSLEAAAHEVRTSDALAEKMILSMIAATGADGGIDEREMGILLRAVEEADIPPAAKARLTGALNQPPTVESVAALASGPEEASELYGAALAAIEPDTPAEHLFLRRFANALKLGPDLVASIHATTASRATA